MSVFNGIMSPALGVLEIAGAASGVPYAQGAGMALQAINTACNQVAIHKVCFPRYNTYSNLSHYYLPAQVCPTCSQMHFVAELDQRSRSWTC